MSGDPPIVSNLGSEKKLSLGRKSSAAIRFGRSFTMNGSTVSIQLATGCNRMQSTPLRDAMYREGGTIVIGVAVSTLFVSTDGNGQNPFPVFGVMLFVAAVTLVVGFLLGWIVRTLPLAMVATVVITDLLFVLYFVGRVAMAKQVGPHLAEEAFLLPIVFVVVTAPTVILTAIAASRLSARLISPRPTRAR